MWLTDNSIRRGVPPEVAPKAGDYPETCGAEPSRRRRHLVGWEGQRLLGARDLMKVQAGVLHGGLEWSVCRGGCMLHGKTGEGVREGGGSWESLAHLPLKR